MVLFGSTLSNQVNLDWQTYIMIAIYFIILLGIGYYGYKQATSNLSEYMLGGRNIGPWVTALSAGASDMSGWMIMGLPGEVYSTGLSAVWITIGLTLGAYINYLVVAPRLRAHTEIAGDAITLPDFFKNRLDDQSASVIQEGQNHIKRVIAEMGGKDAIIVDNEADLQVATDAIVYSAFGFSGQKCSACSRVIAHQDIYDELLERVKEATEKIKVGNAAEPDTYVGPVIDQKSLDKIKNYIEIGKGEGRLVTGGNTDEAVGNFVYPTIFADLDPNSRVMQEEIFGPVVGFTKVKDFDEAIDVANDTEYGLTGAVISNNRMKLEQARRDFMVGNLYFNRGCTGAVVGYQPFGGFKMSGTDSKAGGPDYLVLHMQGRSVSEHL
ncbi:aldehyde dehydrogenase family protein [Staphylococcus pseudintermedius]|nr:aldehyde dehydrogenase family protein [Staphylococcus pseudintermedius]